MHESRAKLGTPYCFCEENHDIQSHIGQNDKMVKVYIPQSISTSRLWVSIIFRVGPSNHCQSISHEMVILEILYKALKLLMCFELSFFFLIFYFLYLFSLFNDSMVRLVRSFSFLHFLCFLLILCSFFYSYSCSVIAKLF